MVNWLDTPAVVGEPLYPVVLDIAESVKKKFASISINSICSTIAKPYEELVELGLAQNSSDLKIDYVNQYTRSQEEYTLRRLAFELTSKDSNFGVIFHNPEIYDHISKRFLDILISRTEINNKPIAINGSAYLSSIPQKYYKYYRKLEKKRIKTYRPNIFDINNPSVGLVACGPQGLPLHVLESLIDHYDENSLCFCNGPSGEKWFFLPIDIRGRIYQKLSIDRRRNNHIKIFDAWDPRGWGYLRRMGHAIAAGDVKRILLHHLEYVNGMNLVGKEFLYSLFVTLSKFSTELNSNNKTCSLALAARLASLSKSKRGGDLKSSIAYYHNAIRECKDAYTKAKLINEIALLYAYQKNPSYLKKSRKWYARAFLLLTQIENQKQKNYLEILLNNGLALVEYHDNNNDKALSLELYALSIASKNREIRDWAFQLCNNNIAKLMMKRFHNEEVAIRYLKENIDIKLSYVQEYTRIELAKYYFNKKNHREVINHLSILLENWDLGFHIENKKQEMLSRFIFTISLLVTGEVERAQKQIPLIQYLCDIFNSVKGNRLLEQIKSCIS